ncbi:hypothetical protein CRG98_035781 [Punica granatum]|uniref:Uncharacterized protein n=1 Tax=Punica granatum TaxID=22663 RepID=A0A2I0IJF1_PUNGR|nr:hypothetical protein CRG98_035781 [Punica granatum]
MAHLICSSMSTLVDTLMANMAFSALIFHFLSAASYVGDVVSLLSMICPKHNYAQGLRSSLEFLLRGVELDELLHEEVEMEKKERSYASAKIE